MTGGRSPGGIHRREFTWEKSTGENYREEIHGGKITGGITGGIHRGEIS